MRITFVTLFPDLVLPAMGHSIVGRAVERGQVSIAATNPRDFATDPHKTVDGRPFGGGPGMVMQCEQLDAAMRSIEGVDSARILFFEPSGDRISQNKVTEWAGVDHLVLVCGHYEGIDQRMIDRWATDVVSLGDFILTGGELPALVVADAVIRTLPGVLGDAQSLVEDSHSDGLLSYPQFTRPQDFDRMLVPEVLVSGDHGAVARWRREQQLKTTRERRPDLFCRAPLSRDDMKLL